MIAVLFRLGLLTIGMAVLEIAIVPAVATGSLLDWAAVLFVGLPLILAGSAGFFGPLLGGTTSKGAADDA